MPVCGLVQQNAAKLQDKSYVRLERDGIYESRIRHQGVHHRTLYLFPGTTAAVVSHDQVKEQVVPPK